MMSPVTGHVNRAAWPSLRMRFRMTVLTAAQIWGPAPFPWPIVLMMPSISAETWHATESPKAVRMKCLRFWSVRNIDVKGSFG